MHFPSSIGSVASLFVLRAIAAPSGLKPEDLDSFVAREKVVALQGALNNIGPHGSLVPGAGAGFVVASPSKADPNCK